MKILIPSYIFQYPYPVFHKNPYGIIHILHGDIISFKSAQQFSDHIFYSLEYTKSLIILPGNPWRLRLLFDFLSVSCHQSLIFISEYGEVRKVTSELLSLSMGSNPVTIRNIVSALKKEGILTVKFGTGGATLNCPLEEITLYRI